MTKIQSASRGNERGGVSIFVVIFTALMVTIVTSSFAQLMVRNQQQASANDLSQSAYDSAMAGVEDAKRALVALRECENDKDTGCVNNIRSALNSLSCQSLEGAGVVAFDADGEVKIGSEEQNQAYTCVKVTLETPNYADTGISAGVPVVIPLKSTESFDSIRLWWFSKKDLTEVSSADSEDGTPAEVAVLPVPNESTFPNNALLADGEEAGSWPKYAPALMRAQLIQFKKGEIDLKEFNKKGTSNARTLFLYPRSFLAGDNEQSFGDDKRRSDDTRNFPVAVKCDPTFEAFGGYACYTEISLPDPEGGTPEDREAYLQLQTYYQQTTSFKVELVRGTTSVNLDEVQPQVDSTGRASSLFRRVKANISLRNDGIDLTFPDAALSISGGGLCKNFFVTDEADSYRQETCDNPVD